MDREFVETRIRERLAEFRRLGVTRLALFGSVARGQAAVDSDIDVLIRLAPENRTFDDFMDVKLLMEDLFPGVKVDVVLEDSLKPAIRDRILAEARDVA